MSRQGRRPAPRPSGPKVRVRRAHPCACPDPTAHPELRSTLGTAYLAVRRSTFVSTVKVLKAAQLEVRAYQEDNVRLARENDDLRKRLKKTYDLDAKEPAMSSGLGGRSAVAVYRNENVAGFMQRVNDLGGIAKTHGTDVADFFLRTVVLANLETLWAAPPATLEEGARRAACEHVLKDPAQRSRLIGTETWSEGVRRDFIADVLASGIDTSTQELVRRSGETPHGPAPRPDED